MSQLLVFGGACSGKSLYAEERILAWAIERKLSNKFYIATAEVLDEEMGLRVARHQARRGEGWKTIPAPRDLSAAIKACDGVGNIILVECITLWVSNLLMAEIEVEEAVAQLRDTLKSVTADIVLVSSEVGLGIVPDNPLARAYRDALGLANQGLAQAIEEVVLVVAGQPLVVKPAGR